MKFNDVVQYHQVSSFSPESMRLQSLHQSDRTIVGDRYNTRYIGLNIKKDAHAVGVRRLPNIWQKVINKAATILKV